MQINSNATATQNGIRRCRIRYLLISAETCKLEKSAITKSNQCCYFALQNEIPAFAIDGIELSGLTVLLT